MKKLIATALLLIAVTLGATAQTYTQRVNNSGKITISQTEKLDSLLNGFEVDLLADEPDTVAIDSVVFDAPVVSKRLENSVNHVYKHGEHVPVYSIMVYRGGNSRDDRERAESIACQMKAKFPKSGTVAKFQTPHWIVFFGAFATPEAAQSMLKQVHRAGFTQATIFRRTVIINKPNEN